MGKYFIRSDKRKTMKRPEQLAQISIFNQLYLLMNLQKHKKFMAIHVPNGGWRTDVEAAIFKQMGTRAGVADIQFFIGVNNICSYPKTVFVELKVYKPQKRNPDKVPDISSLQSESQKTFMEQITGLGFDYEAVIAKDCTDACNQIFKILEKYGVGV